MFKNSIEACDVCEVSDEIEDEELEEMIAEWISKNVHGFWEDHD